MISFGIKANQKSEVKDVFHMELDHDNLCSELAQYYTNTEVQDFTLYGFRVFLQNNVGNRKKPGYVERISEHLDKKGIDYTLEEDVEVTRADEITQEAKAIQKALKDADPEKAKAIREMLNLA